MQVIILAAGRGSRLGAMAEGLPKCLLQVGGEPLLEHQLKALADVGASPVLIVVGYAADLVRDAVRERAETVLNPRYDVTNSLYSLRLARDWVKGPVIVMNSDLLFDREVAELLVRAGPDHLAYDSTSGRASEHMKVRLVDGRVVDLSKTLPKEMSSGENVGMIHLGEATARAVFDKADELLGKGGEGAFWVEALRDVSANIPIRAVDVAHVPWIEIDTPYDLDRARREIWPAILDRTLPPVAKRRRRSRWVPAGLTALLLAAAFAASGILSRPVEVESWEPVVPHEGRSVTLMVKGFLQQWRHIQATESVLLPVVGPRKLRIDIRSLITLGTPGPVPYAVEVFLDDKSLEVEKFTARPRADVAFEGASACDRDKMYVTLPEGPHRVAVRLAAGDVRGLLVRFRVKEEPE